MQNIKSLESTHLKISIRFDIIIDICRYVKQIIIVHNLGDKKTTKKKKKRNLNDAKIEKFSKFWDIDTEVDALSKIRSGVEKCLENAYSLQEKYIHMSSPLICDYYNSEKKTTTNFHNMITSENIIGKLTVLLDDIKRNIKNIEKLDDVSKISIDILLDSIPRNLVQKLTCSDVLSKLNSMYEEQKPEIPAQTINDDNICPQCKSNLVLFPEESEKRCDSCGYIDMLYGTLFDDSQLYNQQLTCSKHKKHNPNLHCAKWLNQLQAKENKNIPQKYIDIINQKAVKEYTRMGRKRSMCDMKCRQIRTWLKEIKQPGLSKLNNHAPLIRKIITGLNGNAVSPPQLSIEEEQIVLNDFASAIEIFEVIHKDENTLQLLGKTVIRNKLYYPFFLLKILSFRLKGDPRLYGLIECIHLQSNATLIKDDKFWQKICEKLPEYESEYEPTNRNLLLDIY
jgi:antitoxin component HigA of HigAB toxin-antitoxin module